uniref:Uncharacterized protein n=1 Tax=viral metagenome TaxID=1070528 RepID=A0A6C0AQD1_9ZZZZ
MSNTLAGTTLDASNPAANNVQTANNPGISGEDAGALKANKRVIVNLRTSINVQGDVDLVSASGELLNNVVVAQVDLSASALYADASHGVIEFWETSGTRGTISACISKSANSSAQYDGFTGLESDLSGGLHGVINGQLNAIAAAPFNAVAYSAAEYNTFASLGDMVLGLYAHYLFGHVAATAAIDNDAALVAYMNGSDSAGAQVGKNLTAALGALPSSSAKAIANQVISQDPSRTRGQDNNEAQDPVHQALMFAPGDIVYVQIAVDEPIITVNREGASSGPGEAVPDLTSESDGAPSSTRATTNLVGSAYPTASPSFAIQITLN